MIVDQFSDYHDLNQYGLMVAKRFVETIDGHPHLTMNIVESMVRCYEAFATPLRSRPRRCRRRATILNFACPMDGFPAISNVIRCRLNWRS